VEALYAEYPEEGEAWLRGWMTAPNGGISS